MRMSFSVYYDRTPTKIGMLCLLLAACLGGCASKNPLMDDASVANSKSTTKTTEPAAVPATTTQTTAAPAQHSDTVTTEPSKVSRFLGMFSPYKIDVQQGNFVSREMVDQLREGMQRPEGVTREQVRFVLGTPLLTDIFHADRWDYTFRLQKRNGEVISSNVTVFFQNNRLTHIDGGNLPTEKEYLADIAGSMPGTSSSTDTK
jgi:outer membrane protein assembly factor BamE